MFKTLLSIVVTLIRLVTTVSLVVIVVVLTMFFKEYANNGETITAICCLVTSFSCIGCIYLIWNKLK